MRDVLAITKALSDGSRVRALLVLRRHELCVCQLVELLGLATSTVSKHMALLEQARLVQRRKNGRWVYYRRAGQDAPAAVMRALRWLDESAAKDPVTQEDDRRLRGLLKVPMEELCSRNP